MPEFKTTDAAEWWAFWHSLPRTGLLPDRSSLDPGAIKHLLPNMMVFDMSRPEAVQFRLAGTEIAERYGFNPTGSDFLDFLNPETREQSRQMLHLAARHPFGVHSALRSRHHNGLIAEIEALTFPFAVARGGPPQLATVSVRVPAAAQLDRSPDSLSRVEGVGTVFIDLGAGLPDALSGNWPAAGRAIGRVAAGAVNPI